MDKQSDKQRCWRVWVDTGGTFTDCIAVDPSGDLHRAKVLSSSALRGRIARVLSNGRFEVVHDWWPAVAALRGPNSPVSAVLGMQIRVLGGSGAQESAGTDTIVGVEEGMKTILQPESGALAGAVIGAIVELQADEEAPILAARLLTGRPAGSGLPPMNMRLGTTRGTNALLERRGGQVALFITEGFGDLLEIGTQQRPDLFALDIRKPALQHSRIIEVRGRLAADGGIVQDLDLAMLEREAVRALNDGIDSAAVVLMHSWTNPQHEVQVAAALRRLGYKHVSISSELAPLIKILPRAQTAVANAYLAGVMEHYLSRVASELSGGDSLDAQVAAAKAGRLHMMTSSGGLVSANEFRPKDSLLSGPAGGVVGAAASGKAAGFDRTIAFDMGGTSTDVSRFDGDYQYVFEHEVGDARIVAPALAIETVAAGGGSICWVDHGMLRVGPQSAGARPGPACYGAGGPLTITDCNLLLGRLDPQRFGIPVVEKPARQRLSELVQQVRTERGTDEIDEDQLLEGFLEIACERMAEAISRISVRQGYDASEYALVAFGGAGGQHACAVASRLGMTRVVLPRDAGLLSAVGLGRAVIERFAERQVLDAADQVDVEGVLSELAAEAAARVRHEGVHEVVVRRRLLQMRLSGQESTITIEHSVRAESEVEGAGQAALLAAFNARYVQLYGHEPPARSVEIESARVVVSSVEHDETAASLQHAAGTADDMESKVDTRRVRHRRVRFAGEWMQTPVQERSALRPGQVIKGPSLVLEAHSTSVVEPGWTLRTHEHGALVLERSSEGSIAAAPDSASSAVRDEVSAGRLAAIARDMGEMLQRTALSTNVKERLDFSCAILDAKGQLIVNAPHVPVHLGAMGVCVRRVAAAMRMEPGDVIVTNHPAFGGSHLPDVTVITPVFDETGSLLAYVASRAHHAEIGGSSPGSMPTRARSLAEEGVVIPPMHLVRGGAAQWQEMEQALSSGAWPSRAVQENLADLRAQVAANRYGTAQLLAFARQSGTDELRHAMDVLTHRAAAGAGRALARLATSGAACSAVECLDDGSPLRVRIEVSGSEGQQRARIDFSGSAPVHAGNLNATPAIVRSAVIYVLRVLVNEPLPLNEGLLANVEIIIPEGILSPRFEHAPDQCPPVAGGNVETSQRLVDVLLKALKLSACSQGTMNNIVFGTQRFGYYETVCGGAGAGPGFHGASAVHTHMTNTRITDPEILEHRYPVRLQRFAIRHGSGGAGTFRGGDGIIREIEFLEPCELSIITQHRAAGPFGFAGGEDGAPGRQWLVHWDGGTTSLAGIDARTTHAGERLIMETPGGGGWGVPGAPQ